MRTYKLILLGLLPLMLAMAGCGGGGGTTATTSSSGSGGSGGGTTQNVATMIVDAGPSGVNSVDIPYITVTICYPGSTSACQTFDHIEVDTGSYGFRILADAQDTSGNPFSLSLPAETDSSSNTLAECTQFVDGYSWGPLATADISIAGEYAGSVPIQEIGDPTVSGESSFPAVPTACSGTGKSEDTVTAFGANGILGVGPFVHDCGSGCATSASNGVYYTCPAGNSCIGSALATTLQTTNPVADFQADNNGVIIELPSISSSGAATVTGSLVFGIDTQSDNALNSQNVLYANSDGDVTTDFNGQSLPYSLFDTGSNAYYFNDSSIPQCTSSTLAGWFCPGSTIQLTATNYAVNSSGAQTGASSTVTLDVGDANTLFSNGDTAYDNIAASSGNQSAFCPTGSSNCSFDFGLPFFFGRNVYIAISGANTSAGLGPFYAY